MAAHALLFGWFLVAPQAVKQPQPLPFTVALIPPVVVSRPVTTAAPPPPETRPVPARSHREAAPAEVKPVAAPETPSSAVARPESSAAPVAAPAAPVPVVPARFDADYLQNPAPVYPPMAKRMGEQGKVLLRAHVLPSGMPDAVEVKQSSGSPRLDQAAVEAVRRWRFVPARQGEEAVASWVLIPIVFNLES